MRKWQIFAAAALLTLGAGSVARADYVGGWAFDDNPGGLERMFLGDNSDDTVLVLRGTARYCGKPGVPYAKVRSTLRRNGTSGQQITWWISNTCDDRYVRVCVQNRYGETACSTYEDLGWE